MIVILILNTRISKNKISILLQLNHEIAKKHPRVFLVPRSCSGCSCSCSPIGRSQLVVRVATNSAAPSLWRPCAQSRRTVADPRHPCTGRAMVPSLLQETETTGSQCRSSVTSRWELYRYTISKGPSAIILHFDFWFVQLYISWYFGKHGGLYFKALRSFANLACCARLKQASEKGTTRADSEMKSSFFGDLVSVGFAVAAAIALRFPSFSYCCSKRYIIPELVLIDGSWVHSMSMMWLCS